MPWRRSEAEQWLREDRMVEGDTWYLVATAWWQRAFPREDEDEQEEEEEEEEDSLASNGSTTTHHNNTTTNENGSHDTVMQSASDEDEEEVVVAVHVAERVSNASLVDTTHSARSRGCVVLRAGLLEGRDFRIVSERVWNRLSHEYGYDWEIARPVVTRGGSGGGGGTSATAVEVYPVAFRLLYWRHGMSEPDSVLDNEQRPFILLQPTRAALHTVENAIQEALESRLHEFFPHVSRERVAQQLQVCFRVADHAPWRALRDIYTADTSSSNSSSSSIHPDASSPSSAVPSSDGGVTMVANATIEALPLETREFATGMDRFHTLLVEGQFGTPATSKTDWRHGLFYSQIRAHEWRFALVTGQLVDALDTDKKWYESRVLAVDATRVQVHYRGWTARWDEWIDRMSPRLAPLHSVVPNWRAFRVQDAVQIGFPVPGRAFPEWKNAHVLEVKRSSEGSATAAQADESGGGDETRHEKTRGGEADGDGGGGAGRAVMEVANDASGMRVRVRVDDSEREVWVDAQSELLCPPGTHKPAASTRPTKPGLRTMSRSSGAAASPQGRGEDRATYSNRYGSQRREYSAYEYGRGRPEHTGVVGLQNLGNTCFMNSMLQCLINTAPLRDYFLATSTDSEHGKDGTGAQDRPLFEKDVNEENPLGMKGMIAREFAHLVRQMWGDQYSVVSPRSLKAVIGQYAPQFAGYQQQDSQEVMNFILDGLHEDLNRVRNKPYTKPVERDGRDDLTVAADEWKQYRLRNDSVIMENFMGQLRSHLTCCNPECRFESVTFDPFMNLSVPIPTDESVVVKVQLFWADGRIPTKYGVRVASKNATIRNVKDELSLLANVPSTHLFFVDVRQHHITRAHDDTTQVKILGNEMLHGYELEFPLSKYELCSSALRSRSSMTRNNGNHTQNLKQRVHNGVHGASENGLNKANGTVHAAESVTQKPNFVRLVALLHQAPVASPVDHRHDDYDFMEDEGCGPKQRRVEVELFNTPLLISVNEPGDSGGGTATDEAMTDTSDGSETTGITKGKLHELVWQAVRRLVTDASTAPFASHGEKGPPYRLHVTKSDGTSVCIQSDSNHANESAGLPEGNDLNYHFTLEWSRNGCRQGYDQKAARRIELHESFQALNISSDYNSSGDVSLVQCLTKFTEREQLGKSDAWYCPKCKEHVRAFKKFDLFSLPKILIFHLKRFRYAQSSYYLHRDKITTQVTFPVDELDLSDFVVGSQPPSDLVYDLFAVSEHSGGLGGGHYTAVAKNPQNHRWFSFNDSFTKETTASEAVTPRAYVLFYVRREKT